RFGAVCSHHRPPDALLSGDQASAMFKRRRPVDSFRAPTGVHGMIRKLLLPRRRLVPVAPAGAGLAGLRVEPGAAQSSRIITSQGIAIHGEPAYPADAKNFAYV